MVFQRKPQREKEETETYRYEQSAISNSDKEYFEVKKEQEEYLGPHKTYFEEKPEDVDKEVFEVDKEVDKNEAMAKANDNFYTTKKPYPWDARVVEAPRKEKVKGLKDYMPEIREPKKPVTAKLLEKGLKKGKIGIKKSYEQSEFGMKQKGQKEAEQEVLERKRKKIFQEERLKKGLPKKPLKKTKKKKEE